MYILTSLEADLWKLVSYFQFTDTKCRARPRKKIHTHLHTKRHGLQVLLYCSSYYHLVASPLLKHG